MLTLMIQGETPDEPVTRNGLEAIDEYLGDSTAQPARAASNVRSLRPVETEQNLAAEQAVIGALLYGGSWAEVAGLVRTEDYSPPHRLILAAIDSLADRGEPHDHITVSEQLKGTGHLVAAGGLAYLSEVSRGTPSAAGLPAYARAVRDQALRRRLPASHRDDDSIQRLKRDLAELDALQESPSQPSIVLRHAADIVSEQREPRWLGGLHKVLERAVLGVLAGPRNTFKSFIGLHWTMTAALNGEPALILSAEGAGLDRRIEAWMKTYAPKVDLRSLPLVALERAVNLNAAGTIKALQAAIDAQKMCPSLSLIDTFSKYAPGLDENDNAAVALHLSLLTEGLRDHYDSAVLLVAHSGHTDAKRPRGASVLMANPDAEYMVERPDPTGMTATVTRERFKDSASLQPLAYTAEVVDLGRVDSHGDPVTSLVVRNAELAAVPGKTRDLQGKAQKQLLAALRANTPGTSGVWTIADIREIGRKAGLSKGSARSAAEALSFTPHLTPALGGWRLTDAKG